MKELRIFIAGQRVTYYADDATASQIVSTWRNTATLATKTATYQFFTHPQEEQPTLTAHLVVVAVDS